MSVCFSPCSVLCCVQSFSLSLFYCLSCYSDLHLLKLTSHRISHKGFFYSQRKFCSISSHKVNILHGNLAVAFYFQLSIQILRLSSWFLVCHKDWKKVTEKAQCQ